MKIGSIYAAFSGTQNNSTEPAAQSAKGRPAKVDALATTGREAKVSVDSALPRAPSRPNPMAPQPVLTAAKQGPFTRLPIELTAEVLSWLKYEDKQVQQIPRAVSRAFYQASVMGLPEVNDRIASGYLRQILRQKTFTKINVLEKFFVQHAPKMRTINLEGSYKHQSSAKDAF